MIIIVRLFYLQFVHHTFNVKFIKKKTPTETTAFRSILVKETTITYLEREDE